MTILLLLISIPLIEIYLFIKILNNILNTYVTNHIRDKIKPSNGLENFGLQEEGSFELFDNTDEKQSSLEQDEKETEEDESTIQDYHCTAVLSTIASNAPGELVGIAFDSEFLLAKTEDVSQEVQQEEDNYVAGLEWGEENGADVVTTSLGYLDWYEYDDMDGNTAVTTIGVDIAAGLGMVCVTAAGNSGNDDLGIM